MPRPEFNDPSTAPGVSPGAFSWQASGRAFRASLVPVRPQGRLGVAGGDGASSPARRSWCSAVTARASPRSAAGGRRTASRPRRGPWAAGLVGWVPERFPADQPFTAEQYLRRTAAMRGRADPDAVDRWIERLLLTDHAGTRLAELSKGTAQKVGLAQALLVPPGLLVLDEPWEGLDAVARTLVPEIVAEVTAAGGAVLVSDHRGEIAGCPARSHWTVADGTVTPAAGPRPTTRGRRGDRGPSGRRRPGDGPAPCRRSPRPRRTPIDPTWPRRAGTGRRRPSPMIALVRMRLAAFLRSGRALAPADRGAGGPRRHLRRRTVPAAAAYGYSAAALFPVLAWLTKLLLDTEPDVQRRLARVAVGAGREAVAGLLAAGVVALVVCALGDARAVALRRHRRPGPAVGRWHRLPRRAGAPAGRAAGGGARRAGQPRGHPQRPQRRGRPGRRRGAGRRPRLRARSRRGSSRR